MTSETTTIKRAQCPSCDHKGKRVSPVTLRALLKEPYASGFAHGEHSCCSPDGNGNTGCQPITGDTGWRFCDSPDCDVVYFSEEGDATFTKSQLSVLVGVKEKTGERPLCYCFKHSVASIKDELATTGTLHALDDIRAKMKERGCRCETENPSGSCCLGSVAKGIKIAKEELKKNDSGNPALPVAAATNVAAIERAGNKGETIAKVGTIVSAIMASACCWLPLVLFAVGVSGAGIASALEAYRPLFMTITFGFLGTAFYLTYRTGRNSASGENDCCATESIGEACCATVGKRRLNMITMNKLMLWGVTVLAVAFLFFPSYVEAILGSDGTSVTENMNQAVIKVEGMTCKGCSAVLAKAIKTVPGVLAVEVNYEKGEAIIGTEICCPIPTDDLLTAIEAAGYSAVLIEHSTE